MITEVKHFLYLQIYFPFWQSGHCLQEERLQLWAKRDYWTPVVQSLRRSHEQQRHEEGKKSNLFFVFLPLKSNRIELFVPQFNLCGDSSASAHDQTACIIITNGVLEPKELVDDNFRYVWVMHWSANRAMCSSMLEQSCKCNEGHLGHSLVHYATGLTLLFSFFWFVFNLHASVHVCMCNWVFLWCLSFFACLPVKWKNGKPKRPLFI